MTDLDGNIQAYRVMAEVLIGLRKIILRGLIKQAGDRWFADACPAAVYERLVDRKETELAIDRLSSDYQDLMSFATFADLADMLEANDELSRLMRSLAPTPQVLIARLLELESLRAKLAMARALNDDELTVLVNYSVNLRDLFEGAKRRRSTGDPRAPRAGLSAAPRPDGSPEPSEEPAAGELVDELDERVGGVDTLAAPDALDPSSVVEEVAATAAVDEAMGAEPEPPPDGPVPRADAGGPAAAEVPGEAMAADEVEELAARPAAAEAPAEEAAAAEVGDRLIAEEAERAPLPRAPLVTVDPEALGEEMVRALSDGDQRAVLRLLRREIIAVSEAAFRLERVPTTGWNAVREAGWHSSNLQEPAVAAIEEFYGLIGRLHGGIEQHRPQAELRDLLGDQQFSKLLLRLREVFLAAGV